MKQLVMQYYEEDHMLCVYPFKYDSYIKGVCEGILIDLQYINEQMFQLLS